MKFELIQQLYRLYHLRDVILNTRFKFNLDDTNTKIMHLEVNLLYAVETLPFNNMVTVLATAESLPYRHVHGRLYHEFLGGGA